MSSIKNRLAQLEKRAHEGPAQRVDVIEIRKSYEDGHTEIETMRADIIAKLEAVTSGDVLPEAQPMTEEAAEILQRLERIAEVQREQH